jgi:putative ABC transport system permease protein
MRSPESDATAPTPPEKSVPPDTTPLGALLAALMVHVINRRSFGWSMEIAWTARPFVEAMILALGAALLAGLIPAWRLGKTDPALALKLE